MLFFKPKVKKTYWSYQVNVQPDINIKELAEIIFSGLQFSDSSACDRFFESLSPECQRHLSRTQREYES